VCERIGACVRGSGDSRRHYAADARFVAARPRSPADPVASRPEPRYRQTSSQLENYMYVGFGCRRVEEAV
jgi:hypothetical protein